MVEWVLLRAGSRLLSKPSPVASVDYAVAERFGIAFELSDKLQEIYVGFGNNLAEKNAGDDWRLPVPATFVIAPDGRIAFADVDADYRHRADPEQVIEILEKLRQAAPA